MEFTANSGKQVRIETSLGPFDRHVIQTHFVQIGESYVDLVRQYVLPLWREGDVLSSSEKIIALCQKRVVYKKDMRLGWIAKVLSRFAMHSDAGIGVDSPWKMQFAIDHCGLFKVLWAAFRSALGKLFGKRGIFYEIVGQEVTGLDGFYDHEFEEYGNYGIRIPENSAGVCNEVYAQTGVRMMIVDANDLTREILGKGDCLSGFTDEQLLEMIRDNPAGQGTELTPLVLIRPVQGEHAASAPETAGEPAPEEPEAATGIAEAAAGTEDTPAEEI